MKTKVWNHWRRPTANQFSST